MPLLHTYRGHVVNFDNTRPYLLPLHEYTYRKTTKYLVVHCSATNANWDGDAEDIREWHIDERGWMDIGYHFVITRNGTIQPGRPPLAVGAGVRGHNHDSLHICMVGGVDGDNNPDDNFTEAQYISLNLLLNEAWLAYGETIEDVCGHRDFPGVNKACPSFDVESWWGNQEYDFLMSGKEIIPTKETE